MKAASVLDNPFFVFIVLILFFVFLSFLIYTNLSSSENKPSISSTYEKPLCVDGERRNCSVNGCQGEEVCSGGKWLPCSWKKICSPGEKYPCYSEDGGGCTYGYKICNKCGTGFSECFIKASSIV